MGLSHGQAKGKSEKPIWFSDYTKVSIIMQPAVFAGSMLPGHALLVTTLCEASGRM
jgi:hypothetical protein